MEETSKFEALEKLNCSPEESVWDLTSRHRALGRLLEMNIVKPGDQDEDQLNQMLMNSESARDLAKDCFWALFQSQPEHNEPAPSTRLISDKIMRWVQSSTLWEKNRQATVNSLGVSVATAGLLYSLLMTDDAIREALKEQEKANEQKKQTQKDMSQPKPQPEPQKDQNQDSGSPQDGQGDQENQEGGNNAPDSQKEAQEAISKAEAELQEAADKLDKHLESNAATSIRANAIQEAGKEAQKISGMASAFGMTGELNNTNSAPKILEAFEKLQAGGNIQKLLENIGRARGIAMEGLLSKRKAGLTDTVVNSGFTQEIMNIFPSERSLLRPGVNPLIRAQKIVEYADRGLLGMQRGQRLDRHGSLIVALDVSSSMSHALSDGMSRIDFARAIALGISQASKANNQKFQMFCFSDYIWDEYAFTDESNFSELCEFIGRPTGGGTALDDALFHACVEALKFGSKAENTDLVFITDAEANLDQSIAKMSEMKDIWRTRLITLQISNDKSSRYEDLEKLSDAFIQVSTVDDFQDITKRLVKELR